MLRKLLTELPRFSAFTIIRQQVLEKEGRLPDAIVACGSGGSSALGAFKAFIEEP